MFRLPFCRVHEVFIIYCFQTAGEIPVCNDVKHRGFQYVHSVYSPVVREVCQAREL